MTPWVRWCASLALLVLSALRTPPAQAERFHECAGFIDSVPATLTRQGVWCLRKDLSTAIDSGVAIEIAANNVTLDCNGFKIGGLAAGNTSQAVGIGANDTVGGTIRHCGLRGFRFGILVSGSGHHIEDNRLDNNLFAGIAAIGEDHLVQRNRVFDTGGAPDAANSWGIYAAADIIDNTVAGVFAPAPDAVPIGIEAYGNGIEVRGNRVRRLTPPSGGVAVGISVQSTVVTIANNRISAEFLTTGIGIDNLAGTFNFCTGNTIYRFTIWVLNCAGMTPVDAHLF